MTKKIKLALLSSSLSILSIPIFVSSCSKQPNLDFSLLEKVVPQIGFGILPVFKFNQPKSTIKISDLDKENEYSLNWKLNPNVTNKNEINELNSILSKVNIKFSHYLIPQINNDGKANLFFDIELKENKNLKTIANITFDEFSKINNLNIENLPEIELKNILSSKIINSGLNVNISDITKNYFINNRSFFENKSSSTKNSLIVELLDILKKEITLKVKNLNINSQYLVNLFFVNNSIQKPFLIKEASAESFKKYKINLFISTSEEDTQNYYEFIVPFNLEYDIRDEFLI